MNVRTGSTQRDTGRAFTLVELLLAVALLVLLLGAVVFNFSSLQRGATLDEGVNQIGALIRYARAQAASSGRQLQLSFEPHLTWRSADTTPPPPAPAVDFSTGLPYFGATLRAQAFPFTSGALQHFGLGASYSFSSLDIST